MTSLLLFFKTIPLELNKSANRPEDSKRNKDLGNAKNLIFLRSKSGYIIFNFSRLIVLFSES